MLLTQTISGLPPWQAHVDVWLFILGIISLGFYVSRVIQPSAVARGLPAITSHQKLWFATGVAFMWLASDWPVHDIAEGYLYSVHMVQHLILTLVVPPAILMATPEWLARAVLGTGRFRDVVRFMTRPIPAALVYNLLVALTHAAFFVNDAIRYSWVHFLIHSSVMLSAFFVWNSICGPIPEWRLTFLGRGIHLFLLSVIPTIPAAFLTTSTGVLYEVYNRPDRLWGVTVIGDQQAAGLVMKIGGGMYLWTIILITFIKGVQSENSSKNGRRGTFVPTVRPEPLEADGVTASERRELQSLE